MSLIILAGGKSTRLNTDKAFLKFKGKFLVETIIDKLINLFGDIIIVANDNLNKYNGIIEKYNNHFLKNKINKKIMLKKDLIENKGPLGGIYTGLKTSKDNHNFVLACDMPFINVGLIKHMLNSKDFDAVVPRIGNNVEPLYAVYNKNILLIIENQIKNNKLKIREAIKKIKNIKYIKKGEIKKFDKNNVCFFNINNKEDFEKAKEIVNEEEL